MSLWPVQLKVLHNEAVPSTSLFVSNMFGTKLQHNISSYVSYDYVSYYVSCYVSHGTDHDDVSDAHDNDVRRISCST